MAEISPATEALATTADSIQKLAASVRIRQLGGYGELLADIDAGEAPPVGSITSRSVVR
jgi:hypothetical protein